MRKLLILLIVVLALLAVAAEAKKNKGKKRQRTKPPLPVTPATPETPLPPSPPGSNRATETHYSSFSGGWYFWNLVLGLYFYGILPAPCTTLGGACQLDTNTCTENSLQRAFLSCPNYNDRCCVPYNDCTMNGGECQFLLPWNTGQCLYQSGYYRVAGVITTATSSSCGDPALGCCVSQSIASCVDTSGGTCKDSTDPCTEIAGTSGTCGVNRKCCTIDSASQCELNAGLCTIPGGSCDTSTETPVTTSCPDGTSSCCVLQANQCFGRGGSCRTGNCLAGESPTTSAYECAIANQICCLETGACTGAGRTCVDVTNLATVTPESSLCPTGRISLATTGCDPGLECCVQTDACIVNGGVCRTACTGSESQISPTNACAGTTMVCCAPVGDPQQLCVNRGGVCRQQSVCAARAVEGAYPKVVGGIIYPCDQNAGEVCCFS